MKKHFVCLGVVGLLASGVAGQVTYRNVALSGQTVPGGELGTVFTSFSYPTINDVGRVAFRSSVSGPGASDRIYIEDFGGMRLVARTGSAAPGTGAGVVFNSLDWAIPDDAGRVVFSARLSGAGVTDSNDGGVWQYGSGALTLAAREGSPAPGMPSGVTFTSSVLGLRHNRGQIAFWSGVTGPGIDATNSMGIWSGEPGSLAVAVRTGDQAPGMPSGVKFKSFLVDGSNWLQQLNDSGQVTFRATLTTGYRGLWMGSPDSLGLVAGPGSPAPGVEPESTFNSFGEPTINNAGEVAFGAYITGPGVGTNNAGVWSGLPESLSLVARRGQQPPGTAAGVIFDSFSYPPVLNAAGHTAFIASLTGTGITTLNDYGLWSDGSGSLVLIAREGDAAPGTPDGVTFGSLNARSVMNSRGQTAFWGAVRGPGITSANNEGIWVTDLDGACHLLAREGDPFQVAPGDWRTISTLNHMVNVGGGGQNGEASSFNDRGDLTFYANFTDGSAGVFVANIPEPATLHLLALGGLAAPRWRKRWHRQRQCGGGLRA